MLSAARFGAGRGEDSGASPWPRHADPALDIPSDETEAGDRCWVQCHAARNRYTHVSLGDEVRAIESLPHLPGGRFVPRFSW